MTGNNEQENALVLLDIDGVLALWPSDRPQLTAWPAESWRHVQPGDLEMDARATFAWSTAVIAALGELAERPGVDFEWCTTWQDRATDTFAPLTGLGERWAVNYAWQGGYRPGNSWWKAFHAIDPVRQGRTVVWIDDEVDLFLDYAHSLSDRDRWRWVDQPNLLTISTNPRIGLTPEHISRISAHLQQVGPTTHMDSEGGSSC